MRLGRTSLVLAVGLVAGFAAVSAAESAIDQEVRAELRSLYEDRLREALQLRPEQVAVVMPKLEALHRERRITARQTQMALRDLRLALRSGAGDAELARGIERIERLESEERERLRLALADIDRSLTVRQRAELRLFVGGFRRMIEGRLSGMGRGGGPRRGRRPIREDPDAPDEDP